MFRRTFTAFVIAIILETGSGFAQMTGPKSEAYDTPPVSMHQDSPQSPHQEILLSGEEAKQTSEPGAVLLRLNVDIHGFPSHVMVIRGPNASVDERAVELVHQDRFKPATKDAKPVLAPIYLKITFDTADIGR
jgi:hypothetical protein